MNTLSVSIIICTRNRANSLFKTLCSITGSSIPADLNVETLVVDNGSTDHTPQIVGKFSSDLFSTRYIKENQIGQCHARNCGLEKAAGEVVLFTDDDVSVPKHWIEGMCRPILNGEVDAVAGGVLIPPDLKKLVDPWESWFASTASISPRNPERMVGANMAFAKRVLEKVPRFDVELGPGALGFGDETLFSMQLLAAGFRIGSALDVQVEHHFDVTRLSNRNFRNLARRMGRSAAYIQHHWEQTPSTIGRREAVISWVGLWRRRFTRPMEWLRSSPPPAWELQRLQDLAFYRQYQVERARKPNHVRDSRSGKIAAGPLTGKFA